ncbi:serine hydrolase domain-containing protein [Algoriphagus sp.]|uniref:serine hydrolase domain-containing protein n=1 Tax=Algoriphagus sp. TaxID=1872435 RepID=UPI0026242B65|nr:serine hydrolase domain-containing protein [Algoriphagus sp.]
MNFFKGGKRSSYSIESKDDQLHGKNLPELRFDAFLAEDSSSLNGILTHDLWVQSLSFEKRDHAWVSKISKPEIIDTDYRVYLEFFRDSTGVIVAIIQSNTENRALHFTIDQVLIDGNRIDFKITNDRFSISALHNQDDQTIQLSYGNSGGKREIALTKLPNSELEGYLPRTTTGKYHYQVPDPKGLGREVASLDEVGIDRSMLGFMQKMNSRKFGPIHSLISTKNRKLVFEEYFHGYDRNYLHDLRSAFKSIGSLALGRAMMKNKELSVKDTMLDFYPEYNITDELKKKISIPHSLTRSTGIQLEDEDKMQWEYEDWVGYKLNLPMKHAPGKVFEYSSEGSNLLTGVIEKSVTSYLPLFPYQELLLPMKIKEFLMLTSPKGRGYLAGSFYLRPVDLIKFGWLILDKEKWKGKQLIEEDWIEVSTMAHSKGNWPKNSDYGYLWRLLDREIDGKQLRTIEAWGNGGQFLSILPELDVTVTFTGGNYNLFPEMEERPFSILNEYIFPAIGLA